MNKFTLLFVGALLLVPVSASAAVIVPGYRLRDVVPLWSGSGQLPEAALNAQAIQHFEFNKETMVGTILPVHPRNSNIVFISTVRYPTDGLANYTIYTYSLKKGTLWKFMETRLANISAVEARGLEPVGFDGNKLILRRVVDIHPYFPCAVSLPWLLLANRNNLVTVDINAKVKKILPYTLPANIAAVGQKDQDLCRRGLTSITNNDETDIGTSQNVGVGVSVSGTPQIAGCSVYAPENPWNKDISSVSVRAESQSFVTNIGADAKLQVGFGSDAANGIPYNVIGVGSTWYPISFTGNGEKYSSSGPYPIPEAPLIEANNPRRLIVLDRDSCYFYEMLNARVDANNTGAWLTDLGAVFYFKADWLRPQKWPAATASGLPLLPALVKYDEVAAGRIRHPLMFTAQNIQKQFIAPATAGGSIDNGKWPAFGARFRLKADYDTSRLSPQAKVIAEALKTYGMYLGDYGAPWTILGTPDPRWDDADLAKLSVLPGSAFEVVDTGPYVHLWFE